MHGHLTRETFVFDPRPYYPLRVSVARYTFPDSQEDSKAIGSEACLTNRYTGVRGAKSDAAENQGGVRETSQLGQYSEVKGAKAIGVGKGVKPEGEGSQLDQYPEVQGVKRDGGKTGGANEIRNETSQVAKYLEVRNVKAEGTGDKRNGGADSVGNRTSQLGQYAGLKGVEAGSVGKGVLDGGRPEEVGSKMSQLGVYPEVRDEGLTLVFAHGTGFTKESWEPTLEDLTELVKAKAGSGNGKNVKIKEIWSVEAPNHGDSVALNTDVLKKGYEEVFGWEEYARVLHLFMTNAGTGLPPQTDFARANVVGVGHSMGAAALVLTMGYTPRVRWKAVVLCDLMCMPDEYGKGASEFLVGSAVRRRDRWGSREEAGKSLLKGRGTWDKRVLSNYVHYGLKEAEGEVTLKCGKVHEAACYRDSLGPRRAYMLLPAFVREVETHLVYGEENDYLPWEVKEDILRVVGGKAALGSFARVPGAGHLIPQMNPGGLAEKVYEALALALSAQPISTASAKL